MTQQPQGRKSLLPHFLATLYGLAIVYASLQPFLNWMEPVPGSPYFLFARWPPRWVRYDVIINILAYLPLGFFVGLSPRGGTGARRLVAALTAGALLSLAMETSQMYLPTRYASAADLAREVLYADSRWRNPELRRTLNARLMGVAPTGNGRRESFAHVPMPRMTNTYMLAGDRDPGEIIASVKRGLYAKNFGGGQVDIVSGKFVFSASEAYMVEDGKITYPVKGATLIGNGPDALTRVSMIGNDMSLDPGVGTCGKEGQSVPVGVGQPTLRIDGLTVGGTAS